MPAKNAVVGFVMTILCLAAAAPGTAAEATLRVDGVPNRLVLPLKEGGKPLNLSDALSVTFAP